MKLWPTRATATVTIALLVAGVAVLLLRHRGSKELKYQSHPIEHWFAQLPATVVSTRSVSRAESTTVLGQQYGNTGGVSQCFVALDSFGTNAIPYYLWKLQNSDSFLEQKAVRLAVQSGVRTVPFRNAVIERGQAVTALIHVKELAPDTLQTLSHLSTNAQPDIAVAAKYVLAQREALPHLLR